MRTEPSAADGADLLLRTVARSSADQNDGQTKMVRGPMMTLRAKQLEGQRLTKDVVVSGVSSQTVLWLC